MREEQKDLMMGLTRADWVVGWGGIWLASGGMGHSLECASLDARPHGYAFLNLPAVAEGGQAHVCGVFEGGKRARLMTCALRCTDCKVLLRARACDRPQLGADGRHP